jgi:hypothetical protein
MQPLEAPALAERDRLCAKARRYQRARETVSLV